MAYIHEVSINALSHLKATQQTIGTTAVQIAITSLTDRRTISLKASNGLADTDFIYVGEDSSVTSSTGYELGKGDSVDLEVDDTSDVWVIGSAASLKLCILEIAL